MIVENSELRIVLETDDDVIHLNRIIKKYLDDPKIEGYRKKSNKDTRAFAEDLLEQLPIITYE